MWGWAVAAQGQLGRAEVVWDVEGRLWMRRIPFSQDQLRVGLGIIYLNLSDHYLYCSILGLL